METETSQKLSQDALEKLAETFHLLSDAKRLSILQLLKDHELTVGEIVEKTGLKQAAVSKQLGLMFHGRILERRKEGNRVYYRSSDSMIQKLCGIVCEKLKKDQSEFAGIDFSAS